MENYLRNRIRERLDALGMNAFAAAKAAGLERTFLSELLSGKKSSIRQGRIPAIADVLDCDAEYLTGVQDEPRKKGLSVTRGAENVPVAGVCKPGVWRPIAAHYPSVPVAADPRFPTAQQAVYICRGDAAAALGISDGDMILTVSDAQWSEGDIVVVRRLRSRGTEQELSVVRAFTGVPGDAEVVARAVSLIRNFQ
jgi:transcriptional regulator with XRE-family HTH domain